MILFPPCRYTVEHEDEFCDLSLNATDVCKDNIDSTLWKYKYVLYLGQLLMGIGTSPLYILGICIGTGLGWYQPVKPVCRMELCPCL